MWNVCQMNLHCVEKYSAKQDFCIFGAIEDKDRQLSGFWKCLFLYS